MSELPVSTLMQIVFGDNMDLDKSGDAAALPNPLEQLKHDGAVRAVLGKSNGASVLLDLSLPEGDVDSDDAPLYKSPMIVRDDGRRTLRKKLGITRVEEFVTESGDKWLHGFNAANELIDARLLE
jgi:hypothetical protein